MPLPARQFTTNRTSVFVPLWLGFVWHEVSARGLFSAASHLTRHSRAKAEQRPLTWTCEDGMARPKQPAQRATPQRDARNKKEDGGHGAPEDSYNPTTAVGRLVAVGTPSIRHCEGGARLGGRVS